MSGVGSYRTNYQQLVQFKDVFLTNSKNMSSLGKYVTFGGLSVSVYLLTKLDPTKCVVLVVRLLQQAASQLQGSPHRPVFIDVQLCRLPRSYGLLHGPDW